MRVPRFRNFSKPPYLVIAFLLLSGACGCQEEQGLSPSIPTAPRDGLVSEYLFSSNFDDSVGGDHGLAAGEPAFVIDRFGHPFNALSLDGIDDKVTATRARFAKGDSVSISMWVRFHRVSFLTVVMSGEFSVVTDVDFLHGPQVLATFRTTCDRPSVCAAIGDMSRGFWHHVLATYDGLAMVIYVDGTLVNQLVVSSKLYGSDQPLTFGVNASDFFWEGELDDVRIYERSISNMMEVSDLYHEGGYAR